jgi:hypothetical protein
MPEELSSSGIDAAFEKITFENDASILFKHVTARRFQFVYHYHPEIELIYLAEGDALEFIGDSSQAFKAGHLVPLGSNLSHLWINDPECQYAEACVVQFKAEILGEAFYIEPKPKEPTNLYLTTQVMVAVLKMGGWTTGGLDFDAKVGRESFEPVDLFYAHIGGMDAFARGLKSVAAIRADGRLAELVKSRYASWDNGIGASIEASKEDFVSVFRFPPQTHRNYQMKK